MSSGAVQGKDFVLFCPPLLNAVFCCCSYNKTSYSAFRFLNAWNSFFLNAPLHFLSLYLALRCPNLSMFAFVFCLHSRCGWWLFASLSMFALLTSRLRFSFVILNDAVLHMKEDHKRTNFGFFFFFKSTKAQMILQLVAYLSLAISTYGKNCFQPIGPLPKLTKRTILGQFEDTGWGNLVSSTL